MGATGHTPETIQARVRRNMGHLTASERRVGRAFLAAYPIAGLETLAQLAERAMVSGPTVMRFVNRLGFDGYPDFQQALRQEVQEKLTSSLALMERQPHEPEEEVLSFSLNTFVRELHDTFASLPPAEFRALIDLLADGRRPVLTTGGRFSHILAFYLTAHLNMMRSGCRFIAASPTPRFDELIDVDRRAIVVAFDYRRYQNSTIEFAKRAAGRGAGVVLFTDPWLSPIAGFARHVLTSSVVAPSPFDSLVPAMATVEAVIAGLATRLGDKARPRMEELERLRSGTTWGEVELSLDGSRQRDDSSP
jgi:DNA-binding MurR/RpiR family transcriptional regulator